MAAEHIVKKDKEVGRKYTLKNYSCALQAHLPINFLDGICDKKTICR
jgi:hypothetical protein